MSLSLPPQLCDGRTVRRQTPNLSTSDRDGDEAEEEDERERDLQLRGDGRHDLEQHCGSKRTGEQK
jgi:hypothetical protein